MDRIDVVVSTFVLAKGIMSGVPSASASASPLPLPQATVAAAAVVKQEGLPNDMIARVEADPAFGLTREEIEAELAPEAFTGRSAEQVTDYLNEYIRPVLDANPDALGQKAELSV